MIGNKKLFIHDYGHYCGVYTLVGNAFDGGFFLKSFSPTLNHFFLWPSRRQATAGFAPVDAGPEESRTVFSSSKYTTYAFALSRI